MKQQKPKASEKESFNDTKNFLSIQLAAGRVKNCPTCPSLIGADYDACGPCSGKEKAVAQMEEIQRLKLGKETT